jgi:hypothetical protein
MVSVAKTLSQEEKDILASLVGSRLVRAEAALAAPPDGAWNTMRLRTDRGSVDVSCLLETLPLNDVGDEEEFGVLCVARAGEGRLEVPGVSADVCELPLSGTVTGVEVRGDRLDLYERGELIYSRETSKAVVLLTDLGAVCLDRQAGLVRGDAHGLGRPRPRRARLRRVGRLGGRRGRGARHPLRVLEDGGAALAGPLAPTGSRPAAPSRRPDHGRPCRLALTSPRARPRRSAGRSTRS